MLPVCPPPLAPPPRARRGVSLIELIIYTAISSLVVVALTRMTLMVLQTNTKTFTGASARQELRFAQQRITVMLRDSTGVVGASSVFNSDAGVLWLTMSGALSPTVFSLAGNRILMRQGASATTYPLTSADVVVDQLRFADVSAAGTHGTYTLTLRGREKKAPATEPSLTLVTAVTRRR